MSIKINTLELENIKRIKAIKLEPTANGLTVIGGKNNQGKTSVLDSIAWALGGDRYKPSSAMRDGSTVPPYLKITMSNGFIVERGGENSNLKVIDPKGKKGGQQLLNEFVETFALDLPKFMNATDGEKAQTLLNVIGVGEELFQIEQAEKETYNRRHTLGQIADQKLKYAKELPLYSGVPKEPVSARSLIMEQQEIMAKNGENQRKRQQLTHYEKQADSIKIQLQELIDQQTIIAKNLAIAKTSAKNLQDESTQELERNLQHVEQINIKVRANIDREKAVMDAADYKNQCDELTSAITSIRNRKTALLKNANLPLPELSVAEGKLLYKGKHWNDISGSDQLKVSTAIVRRLNPNCGFVLLDKLEQMDKETLLAFGVWLEKEELQAIATRVSTGDECSIIIEDGYVAMS